MQGWKCGNSQVQANTDCLTRLIQGQVREEMYDGMGRATFDTREQQPRDFHIYLTTTTANWYHYACKCTTPERHAQDKAHTTTIPLGSLTNMFNAHQRTTHSQSPPPMPFIPPQPRVLLSSSSSRLTASPPGSCPPAAPPWRRRTPPRSPACSTRRTAAGRGTRRPGPARWRPLWGSP